MTRFSKPILLTAVCVLVVLSDGCSSPATSERSAPRPSAATAPTAKPVPVAKQYPHLAQDLSSFNLQAEAAKMGIQLYPGAALYSSPYTLRRGNYYIQHGFFTTTDSTQQVSEFYNSVYGGSYFAPNEKGDLSALISVLPKDFYKFELKLAQDGNTNIEVTRTHSCENMYPKPCDSTGDPASTRP